MQPIFAWEEKHFKIFGAATWVSPLGSEDVDIGDISDSLEFSDELGWNFGVEFRFNEWIGLEVDYINVTNDVELGDATVGEIDFSPLSASLNFHIVHTDVIDLYLAPTGSWV